jgi:alkylhydroperoxidase family enzyme
MTVDAEDLGRPRIVPIEAPDHEQTELLAKTFLRPDGSPLNLFSTLARHPRLMKRMNALGGVFMAHASIPTRDRELVILRVAARTRSRYEFAQHAEISARDGITEAQLQAVVGDPDEGGWDAGDRLLLRFVDELVEHDAVGAETWAALSARFDDAQLLELVCLVGYYRMIAGYLRSVLVQTEPGVVTPGPAAGPGWR